MRELAATKIDMSKVYQTKSRRPRHVGGRASTSAADSTSPQFWVDAEREGRLPNDLAWRRGGRRWTSTSTGTSARGSGWLATKVTMYVGGVAQQTEEYSNPKVGVELDRRSSIRRSGRGQALDDRREIACRAADTLRNPLHISGIGPMRALHVLLIGLAACSSNGGPSSPSPSSTGPGPTSGGTTSPTWDVDAKGVPHFIATSHMDPAVLARISRFRSSVGHDYHDDFESCRSMKHYFEPKGGIDWSTVRVVAPVSGTVSLTRSEALGLQVLIRPTAYPAFTVIVFHITPSIPIMQGTVLQAGQQLGTHYGPQTTSDVDIGVDTPTGYKLVSWFDAITDSLFGVYVARGATTRDAFITTRAARDADPLTCNGETFTSFGTLQAWFQLNPN